MLRAHSLPRHVQFVTGNAYNTSGENLILQYLSNYCAVFAHLFRGWSPTPTLPTLSIPTIPTFISFEINLLTFFRALPLVRERQREGRMDIIYGSNPFFVPHLPFYLFYLVFNWSINNDNIKHFHSFIFALPLFPVKLINQGLPIKVSYAYFRWWT